MQRSTGKLVASVVFLLSSPTIVLAQAPALVNVDISKVADHIARNIKADADQLPLAVQLPIEVAANVCGLTASSLGQQTAASGRTCTAQTSSTALELVVQEKVRENAPTGAKRQGDS